MCGISGLLRPDGNVNRSELSSMRDTMLHRGPDDAGLYISSDCTVGLGHRRLSIIDLTANGHQPMCNEDQSIWLVFNGEIYNFKQLRNELVRAGHRFRSQTDTEVIVHAYEEWGVNCVHHLRGMFAFAVWDEKKRRLFLARDRLGIKPLFYSFTQGNFIFASELKGITAAPDIDLTIDDSAIYDFFTYAYIPTPKTIYQEVKKLPPAHYAIFEDSKLTVTEYWDPPFQRDRSITEAEAADLVLAKLKEVVDLHLVADVPLGVMLSGGLDSSTISALAASGETGISNAFTIGFDVKQHDETPYARMVAEQYEINHRILEITHESAKASQQVIIDLYDEPFADDSAIPTLSVCQLARDEVTVALSGEGGDEIFGGYSWYSVWLRLAKFDFLPQALRGNCMGYPARFLPHGFKGKWTLQAASLDPIERYAKLLSVSIGADNKKFFSKSFAHQFSDYDDYWYFRQFWRKDLDRFSRMQYLDMKTYLHDDVLTKMDRASMAVSLEARVPLLDHELIETVTSLPTNVRNSGHMKKHILKLAMRDYLPHDLLTRKKQGFSVPFQSWLAKPDERTINPIYEPIFNVDSLRERDSVNVHDYWKLQVMNTWLCSKA